MERDAPTAFKMACRNLTEDMKEDIELIGSADFYEGAAQLMLHNLETHDAVALRPFLDKLVSDKVDLDERKAYFNEVSTFIRFDAGEDVLRLLRAVRRELDKGRFASAG